MKEVYFVNFVQKELKFHGGGKNTNWKFHDKIIFRTLLESRLNAFEEGKNFQIQN